MLFADYVITMPLLAPLIDAAFRHAITIATMLP